METIDIQITYHHMDAYYREVDIKTTQENFTNFLHDYRDHMLGVPSDTEYMRLYLTNGIYLEFLKSRFFLECYAYCGVGLPDVFEEIREGKALEHLNKYEHIANRFMRRD